MAFDLYVYMRIYVDTCASAHANAHTQAHLKLTITDQNDSLQLSPDLPTRGDMSLARSFDDFPEEST